MIAAQAVGAQDLTSPFLQRIDINPFDYAMIEIAIPFPSLANSVSKINPIRGAVRTCRETIFRDETLHEYRPIPIAILPTGRDYLRATTEYFGGQVFYGGPGKQNKATVVDHQMQILLALPLIPPDPFVPFSQVQYTVTVG
jgi:hypothetical protein